MANIYQFKGLKPVISPDSYLHETAVVIGDVVIEPNCYIGPYAVLRGDYSRITIGRGCNIQDHVMVHSDVGSLATLQPDCHIGHGAIIHGAAIGRNALIGMNAVVMDNAKIGENSIIGAMAFVKSGLEIPANRLAFGNPLKIIRELKEGEKAGKIKATNHYKRLAKFGLAGDITRCEALLEIEADRPTLDWLKNDNMEIA